MHVIRLREPWEIRSGSTSGQWIFGRKFHRPTGSESDAIQLVITLSETRELSVELNGTCVDTQAGELDVVHLPVDKNLLAFNLLELQVTTSSELEFKPEFGKKLVLAVELHITPRQTETDAGPQAGAKDLLHGITLEMMLRQLVERHGWEEMGSQIPIRCFQIDPSIKSSLTFLRKTPWARKRVEDWYAYDARRFGTGSPPL